MFHWENSEISWYPNCWENDKLFYNTTPGLLQQSPLWCQRLQYIPATALPKQCRPDVVLAPQIRSYHSRASFLSHILSQVTWQVTWPRLRSHVTCGVYCLRFLKWLHKSLGPKSLGLFWNAPYCFPSDALLTSPCISVNIIVTSRANSIVTSLNAAP